ncbi:MAG: hypothetical protein V7L25_33855, partial [Nostoc sp.]|uniref:hypothetical protein n=1 Tax=Nostoc sp. TaxID=1180 RepID=UPI002FEEE0E3
VLLLPSWEKGLGDEGKTSSQSRFFLKLTPMSIAVPLRQMWFKYMKTAVTELYCVMETPK